MKQTKLLFLCIATIIIYSCSDYRPKKEKITVVAGEVINRPENASRVMQWNLCDPFNDSRIAVQLTKDGKFRMETDGINLFHDMTLRYGNNFITFLASPNDSIYIVIDATKIKTDAPGAVHFKGDRAVENNEFYHYSNYMSDIINSDYSNRFDMDMEPKEMLIQFNERLDMYIDSLNVFEKQQKAPMSEKLKDFMRRDIIFIMANMRLHWSYKDDNNKAKLELYGDPFFGINDSLSFNSAYFPTHLEVYMYEKLSSDTIVNKAFEQQDYKTQIERGIPLLMKEPATLSRDVMIWIFLSDMVKENPELYNLIAEHKGIFTDLSLDAKLIDLSQAHNNKIEFPVTPLEGVQYMESDGTTTTLPAGDIFAYFTQKYPNKVLYIDVYASWCAPCIEEMEYLPALYENMKGKDIAFIYLCGGSTIKGWNNIVTKFGLKENYWLNSDASNLLLGIYNLTGYPTYILVGKDGQIKTMKAPRPSELKILSEQIDELL